VERRERIVEGMKFEDIVPGIQLRVSPNSIEKYAHIMHTLGRIGVVAGTPTPTSLSFFLSLSLSRSLSIFLLNT
jgi:hypothetical protein